MKRTAVASAWVTLLLATSARAAVSISAAGDQSTQIQQSLASCPSLRTSLDGLASSGKLTRIRVTTQEETRRSGPFSAVATNGEILVTSDWLEAQRHPYSDVRKEGEILPDNLCFGLGHLADHMTAEAAPPVTAQNIASVIQGRLNKEARAYIHGWAYVLEAATAKNGGAPLSAAQIGDLLLNLRYRFAFLQAMDSRATPRLTILAGGVIPDTEQNVAAVSAALSHSTVADIQ